MVFMAVGNDDTTDFLFVLYKITHIGNNQVDAEHIVIREGKTGIDDDDIFSVLNDRHVLTDFAQASQGNYLQLFFFAKIDTSYNTLFIRKTSLSWYGAAYFFISSELVQALPFL